MNIVHDSYLNNLALSLQCFSEHKKEKLSRNIDNTKYLYPFSIVKSFRLCFNLYFDFLNILSSLLLPNNSLMMHWYSLMIQMCIQNPVEHLWCSFLANMAKAVTLFAKKLHYICSTGFSMCLWIQTGIQILMHSLKLTFTEIFVLAKLSLAMLMFLVSLCFMFSFYTFFLVRSHFVRTVRLRVLKNYEQVKNGVRIKTPSEGSGLWLGLGQSQDQIQGPGRFFRGRFFPRTVKNNIRLDASNQKKNILMTI